MIDKAHPCRSVTLVGEADRKMLKAAIKHASGEDQVRHRHVPPESVAKWSQKLNDLKDEIAGVLQEEKEEKQVGDRLARSSLHWRLIRPCSFVEPRWSSRRAKTSSSTTRKFIRALRGRGSRARKDGRAG